LDCQNFDVGKFQFTDFRANVNAPHYFVTIKSLLGNTRFDNFQKIIEMLIQSLARRLNENAQIFFACFHRQEFLRVFLCAVNRFVEILPLVISIASNFIVGRNFKAFAIALSSCVLSFKIKGSGSMKRESQ